MGRKAAIFDSAWRYSETELNRSIAAIAFQVVYVVLSNNPSKPGVSVKLRALGKKVFISLTSALYI
ncbi:hypothetical protein DHW03_04445 [Pedobacter yonginense]|uniref:Uncharacterized protein n=1 Tax=Pedobacter yonginense TaxID=651869 RepID=A0A317EV06_9SPHI|nr:hypothetical protein DHW03_04445 [Pedobacter yonginense]